jgi:hypothetical protein
MHFLIYAGVRDVTIRDFVYLLKGHIHFIVLNWTLQATSVKIDTELSAPVGGGGGVQGVSRVSTQAGVIGPLQGLNWHGTAHRLSPIPPIHILNKIKFPVLISQRPAQTSRLVAQWTRRFRTPGIFLCRTKALKCHFSPLNNTTPKSSVHSSLALDFF